MNNILLTHEYRYQPLTQGSPTDQLTQDGERERLDLNTHDAPIPAGSSQDGSGYPYIPWAPHPSNPCYAKSFLFFYK